MTEASYLDDILGVLHRWDHLGVRPLPNDTILIGHVPHVAPEAWLHKVYAPLPAGDSEVLAGLPVPVHPDYRALLARANGLNLFSGHLCVYGVRSSYARRGEARWQPFDLRIPNTFERVPGAPSDALVAGINTHTQDAFAILHGSGEVVRWPRDRPEVLERWDSLAEMLMSEVERLASLCDEAGHVRE